MKLILLIPLLLMAGNTYATYEYFASDKPDTPFIDNSSLATAQHLGSLSNDVHFHIFGSQGEVSVFGVDIIDNYDTDFYSFEAQANTRIMIDVLTPFSSDGTTAPLLGLFNNAGDLLRGDDDQHISSESGFDSFLSYILEDTEIYTLAITDAFNDTFSIDGGDGDFLYSIDLSSFSLAEPAPAPTPTPVLVATWLFASALFSLIIFNQRKLRNMHETT